MIYATGWPWTSFLIAEKVSRLTSVPYVIDYRDLWKPSDAAWDSATWLQRRLGLILERRVLRRAAGVIATTKSFLSLLPQEVLPAKRFAITNGFSEKDFSGAVRLPKESKHVTIVYTGVWRPGYGPEDLYEAMRMLKTQGYQELSRIRVVTAGFPPGKAAEFGIADFVEERGRVTHAEAISLMANADVLYLPVSKGLYEYASIPGKLFEYLGSNRPVLASTLPQSEVAAALDKVGGALRIDPGDIEGLAGILKKLCAQKDPDIFTKRCSNELSKYSRYNLAGQLSLAFDDAMSSSSYSARSGSPQHEVI
jgi:glycosyltransferase involved in cell wall biosynthesis